MNDQQKMCSWVTVSSGLDWLSLVSTAAGPRLNEVMSWAEEVADLDWTKATRWRFFGYEGWYSDGVAIGERPDGLLIQLRGGNAHTLFSALPDGFRATRLDLQVTCLGQEPQELAEEAYAALDKDNVDKRRKLSLIRSNQPGGGTIYIGSRLSSQMGRLYDKGVQRPVTEHDDVGPLVLWRYEVEYKRELAQSVYATLQESGWRVSRVASLLVYDWFFDRGVEPVFERGYINIDVVKAVSKVFEGDVSRRKIEWLRTSVRPAVKELISAGLLMEVLNALSIEGHHCSAALAFLLSQD